MLSASKHGGAPPRSVPERPRVLIMRPDRPPPLPSDLEAEQRIVSALLAQPALVSDVPAPSDFHDPRFGTLREAIGHLEQTGWSELVTTAPPETRTAILAGEVARVAEELRPGVLKFSLADRAAFVLGLAELGELYAPRIGRDVELVRALAGVRREIERHQEIAAAGYAVHSAEEARSFFDDNARAELELEHPSVTSGGLPLIRVCDIPDPGPVDWLVEKLWVRGAFGIVGAEPKSWKSWLTLYMAICIASGRRVFDRWDVRQGPVLAFSAEGGRKGLRRRTRALCNALDIDIPEALIAIDLPLLHIDAEEQAHLLLETVERVKPVLLLLDPLREIHTGDENDAADVARLLAPLRQLQEQDIACMIVHHLGKRNEARGRGPQRGGQRLRGSSALHGATDSALYLETKGDGEKKRVTVTAEHRDEEQIEPFTLRLHVRRLPELNVWLEVVDEKEEEDKKKNDAIEKETAEQISKREQIIRAVIYASKSGAPLTSKNGIFHIVKGTRQIVMRIIDDLVDEGVIVNVGSKYHPAPSTTGDSA